MMVGLKTKTRSLIDHEIIIENGIKEVTHHNTNDQSLGNRPSVVCTYSRCGLKGHEEEDCRRADNLHSEAFKKSMVKNVKCVVENAVTDRLKLGFPPAPPRGWEAKQSTVKRITQDSSGINTVSSSF